MTVCIFGPLGQGRGGKVLSSLETLKKKKGPSMQIQEAFLPTLKINFLGSGAHPAKCGQSSNHPDDMKSPNGTSN